MPLSSVDGAGIAGIDTHCEPSRRSALCCSFAVLESKESALYAGSTECCVLWQELYKRVLVVKEEKHGNKVSTVPSWLWSAFAGVSLAPSLTTSGISCVCCVRCAQDPSTLSTMNILAVVLQAFAPRLHYLARHSQCSQHTHPLLMATTSTGPWQAGRGRGTVEEGARGH